jgi:hypothetical protein
MVHGVGRRAVAKEAGETVRAALESWGHTWRLCVLLITIATSVIGILWILAVR